VVAGAESTGKTTLSRRLAERFGTVWVPEYGRWYWEGRRYSIDPVWTSSEFRRIGATHHQAEKDLANLASAGLIVLDTDALVTAVWHRRYLDRDDPTLMAVAAERRPDLYLVCAPDFPWVQDGTRESADRRDAMNELTLEFVRDSGVPHEVLYGDIATRLTRSAALIEELARFEPLQ